MKPTKESVLADAMQLSEEDRAELSDVLYQSAAPGFTDPEVEAA